MPGTVDANPPEGKLLDGVYWDLVINCLNMVDSVSLDKIFIVTLGVYGLGEEERLEVFLVDKTTFGEEGRVFFGFGKSGHSLLGGEEGDLSVVDFVEPSCFDFPPFVVGLSIGVEFELVSMDNTLVGFFG